MLRPGDKAWIALGVGVLSYDVLCSDGNTMSEAADSYVLRHPWFTRFTAFALAAHCCNAMSGCCRSDPLALQGEEVSAMTTLEKRRLVPGDVTTVMFGDREVEAVVVHVGEHTGWVLAKVVGDYPDIPYGYVCAKRI
jgi:hypothetical protein